MERQDSFNNPEKGHNRFQLASTWFSWCISIAYCPSLPMAQYIRVVVENEEDERLETEINRHGVSCRQIKFRVILWGPFEAPFVCQILIISVQPNWSNNSFMATLSLRHLYITTLRICDLSSFLLRDQRQHETTSVDFTAVVEPCVNDKTLHDFCCVYRCCWTFHLHRKNRQIPL